MSIKLKRAYDPVEASDGTRIMIDRLWPRAVKKEALHLTLWAKQVAPTTELRKWFSHEPEKWEEFQKRYCHELDANKGVWEPILQAAQKGVVTLVYSAKDTEHNNAVCLKEYLERHMKKR